MVLGSANQTQKIQKQPCSVSIGNLKSNMGGLDVLLLIYKLSLLQYRVSVTIQL